jgi:hypothetical protein
LPQRTDITGLADRLFAVDGYVGYVGYVGYMTKDQS